MRLLAPLLCLAPLLEHIYCNDIVGIVGENFTFPVQIDQKIVETVWKKNKDKVAEWEWQNNPTYFGPLYKRSVLMEDGSLTIFNLEKDDAGPYELQYRVSGKDHYLKFELVVFDSLPEPKIICNISDGELVLNCVEGFPAPLKPLNYSWKLSNYPHRHPNQELSIPLKDVDPTTEATCIIKFSQTERSSEIISLSQCLPGEKGVSSNKRNRDALIVSFILVVAAIILVVLLHRTGILKFGAKRKTAQDNSPVNGSGEHEQLFHGNSQQQPNSEGAAFSRAVHCEDEEPEADRTLNEDQSALKDKQIVKDGVNQEEMIQDAEGRTGEHLNNSSSCSKEGWSDAELEISGRDGYCYQNGSQDQRARCPGTSSWLPLWSCYVCNKMETPIS